MEVVHSNKFIYARLSILIFMQYFNSGILVPIISLYLIKVLNFSGAAAGIILSLSSLASILSSVIGTFVANKFITVERMLAICYFFGALLMLYLTTQNNFICVLINYFLYSLFIGCTNSAATTIVFQKQKNSHKDLGKIQLWGSFGWVFASWVFSFLSLKINDVLMISAIISFVISIYSLTFSKSDINKHEKKKIIPREALSIITKPQNVIMIILLPIIFTCLQYYFFGLAPFLQQNGYKNTNIMPLMSIAQVAEVIALFVLGYFLERLNYKKVFLLGLVLSLFRFVSLGLGYTMVLVLPALACQGFAFAFVFIAAFIYFNGQCKDSLEQAGVQQIMGILVYGIGGSLGSLLGGKAMSMFESDNLKIVNYAMFWAIPAIINAIWIVILYLFFKEVDERQVPKKAPIAEEQLI